MNFRTVYCETVVFVLCLVLVNGIVIVEEIGDSENKTETFTTVAPSGVEINSTLQGNGSVKKDSSIKRGLESSMAYPQGYFPPYRSSNEMHSPVTPPYNRDYEQELNKKGLLYFDRPVLITERTSGRRPLVSNLRPSFNPNNGYFVPTQSYSNDQTVFKNDDRQYTFPMSDSSYSEVSHRPSQNTQQGSGYPANYPNYIYVNDPRRTYSIQPPLDGSYNEVTPRPSQNTQPGVGYSESYPSYTSTNDLRRTYPIQMPTDQPSYQPAFETQRGQSSVEFENGYPGVPRGYSGQNPNQQTYLNYGPERQLVEDTHRYRDEQPQNDRKWALHYQLQVLRELEEQKRRLLQEINSQTQPVSAYSAGAGSVHRRMVPQFSIDSVTNPVGSYFGNERRVGVPSQFQSFLPPGGRRDTTFVMDPAYHRPSMPKRLPYTMDDQNILPDQQGRNFDVTRPQGSFMMPKMKRHMGMVASSCKPGVEPGGAGNVPCDSVKRPIESEHGLFWDYFEHQSLKHLVYRPAGTPPGYPPIFPSTLPSPEDNVFNGITVPDRPSVINGGQWSPGGTDPLPGGGGIWGHHVPIQAPCPDGVMCSGKPDSSGSHVGNMGPGGNLTPGGAGPSTGEHGTSIDLRPTQTNCPDGTICNGYPEKDSSVSQGNLGAGGNLTPGGAGPITGEHGTSIDHRPTQTNCPDGTICIGNPQKDSPTSEGNLGSGGNLIPEGTGQSTGEHGTSINHPPTQTNCVDGIGCNGNPCADAVGGNMKPECGSIGISGGDDSSDIQSTTQPQCEDGICGGSSDKGSLQPVDPELVSEISDHRPSQHFNTNCTHPDKKDCHKMPPNPDTTSPMSPTSATEEDSTSSGSTGDMTDVTGDDTTGDKVDFPGNSSDLSQSDDPQAGDTEHSKTQLDIVTFPDLAMEEAQDNDDFNRLIYNIDPRSIRV